jgi:4-hydroxybenzoate polyprenyltransferase
VDDDPVLRSLAADLEHDDPRLAAFLTAPLPLAALPAAARHHHPVGWLLLALTLLCALVVALPITVAVGMLAMVLVIASPLAVCWLCSIADDPPHPRSF